MSPALDDRDWEDFLASHPDSHILQTSAWGDLKCTHGWSVERVVAGGCGAQILFRRLPLRLTLGYIPKGPIGDWIPQLLPELDKVCREKRAFALKIEPDAEEDANHARLLAAHDLHRSPHTVQPRRTLVIEIQDDEDTILARMRPKTRYNIRLAARKGVRVRPWRDVDGFVRMLHETAERDRFGVHTSEYYRYAFERFKANDTCELLVAEAEGIPLASLMVFCRGARAWYFYGASTNTMRNRMPTYLLQWEAIRWAKARGCTHYDLWGVPDADQETLEAHFTSRQTGLWGVYRFKRGFGGELRRSIGAWDRVYQHTFYQAYRFYSQRMTPR